MPLRFEHRPAEGRIGRGLVPRALETFHYAYAGEVEYAHFFCVPCGRGEVWRWTLLVAGPEPVGQSESAEEARLLIESSYAALLARAGLMERPEPSSSP